MAYNRWINSELEHHQVKGAHWGVHNGPPYPLDRSLSDGNKLLPKADGSPQSKKRKPTPPNTTYVKNHKGPMYFISDKELDGQTLEPRVADNYFTKNGYEDNQTKRISFAPDVGKCLSGLSQNVTGKQFNVYVPDVEDGIDIYKPNSKAVPDAEITQEMWVTDPVKVKKLGSITCTGDTGEDGHKFKYGDKTAELYDWNYKWDQNTVALTLDNKRAMTNGRPLTEKVRSRTADDIKAIEEAQKYDDQQHRRILNGANFLANAKTLGFKIGRYGSNTDNGLPVKKKDTSKDYDLKTINPGGKSTTLSGTNNCLLCTVAYDMRRRGYNVIARQRAPIELLYDIGDEDLSNMYKHTKTIRDESLRGITNKIKRQKNSRGSISCTWNGSNSGHVVAYEVNDGKVTLYDAQSGTRYDDPSKLFSDAHNFRAVRLDNLTPDYRLIKLAVE